MPYHEARRREPLRLCGLTPSSSRPCTPGRTLMTTQHGNLSTTERSISAAVGLGLAAMALLRGHPALRALSGVVAGGLLARAAAGHCGVKSALAGHTNLGEGLK